MADRISQEYLRRLPSDEQDSLVGLPNHEMQRWVLDRSRNIQNHLLCLHRFHNSLVPVNRIPDELLAEIFQIQRDVSLVDEDDIRWLRVSHVCSTWRAVALTHARLWCDINVSKNIAYVQHCLEYSRDAGISISAPMPVADTPTIMNMISRHAGRIHSFSWNIPKHSSTSKFLPMLSFPMVRLECLTIRDKRSLSRYNKGSPIPSFDMFPQLHSLIFDGIYIPLSAGLCSKLRRLEITGYLPRRSFDLDAFRNILKACTVLEHLTLVANCPNIPPDFRFSGDQITLPHLRTLTIGHDMFGLGTLLAMLDIPARTVVNLYCRVSRGHGFAGDGTLKNVLQHDESRTLPVLADVRDIVLSVTETRYDLHAYHGSPDSLRLASLAVQFEGDTSQDLASCFPDAAVELANIFAPSPVRSLRLSAELSYRIRWDYVFSRFPQLQRLEVGSSALPNRTETPREMLEALSFSPESSRDVDDQARCPGLQEFTLSNVEMKEELLKWILDFVNFRAMRAGRLKRLCLRCFNGEGATNNDLLEKIKASVDSFTLEAVDPPPVKAPLIDFFEDDFIAFLDDMEG